jgi:hypothetical protein
VREELRVAGEAVAAEEECALVDGRGRDGVGVARHAQLDGGLDVLGGRAPRRPGLHSRLDVAADVVEVVDDGAVRRRGKRLAAAHDVVAAPEVERARRVREELRVADDDGHAGVEHGALGHRLQDDLGADAGRVAHRDGDARPPARRPLGGRRAARQRVRDVGHGAMVQQVRWMRNSRPGLSGCRAA